jgi:CheY-like chemotaxis protein
MKEYRERFSAPDARILVVDDNSMNLMVFGSLIKQTGVGIDTAGSGDEGIALTRNVKYDMIFLDHMMPEKDGIETLHEIRADKGNPNCDTPAICLTANAISGAKEHYISEGFEDYLAKPIAPEILEEMMLKYIPEDKIEKRKILMGAIKTLTAIQLKTVKLYYSRPGMTERKAAEILGCESSTVHRNLEAAIKKLRKYYVQTMQQN